MGYPSDVSDTEWRIIGRLLPATKPGGRPRATDMRSVIDAIFYLLRSGCAWRMLPRDFPPYSTVYMYFKQWKDEGIWEKIHDTLRDRIRSGEGHQKSPSAAIVDSQSVKTTEKGALAATMQARR
jgi:putative transposase